jgi:hypothetical protein
MGIVVKEYRKFLFVDCVYQARKMLTIQVFLRQVRGVIRGNGANTCSSGFFCMSELKRWLATFQDDQHERRPGLARSPRQDDLQDTLPFIC